MRRQLAHRPERCDPAGFEADGAIAPGFEQAAELGRAGRAHMLNGFTLRTTVPGLARIYLQQRADARGAWRLWVTTGRILLAMLLLVPFVFRLFGYEIHARNRLPSRWRRARQLVRTGRFHRQPRAKRL